LVCNPLPENESLDAEEINNAIRAAVVIAETRGISGAALTPFLLENLNQLTHGKSVQANLTLLRNNARLAAQIAASMAKPQVINY
jgi:pseudouridine-5'-phosphate glycosidase